jgi:OOP family OmpA-OmpF porin
VALRLKQDPSATAVIVGHADSSGSPDGNERLANARAEAARRVLVERHGIDPSRIAVEGRSSGEPAASNDTPEGRSENRRAVIVVRVSG